jgi:hypothetical protein
MHPNGNGNFGYLKNNKFYIKIALKFLKMSFFIFVVQKILIEELFLKLKNFLSTWVIELPYSIHS